jgi:hypothetical protein
LVSCFVMLIKSCARQTHLELFDTAGTIGRLVAVLRHEGIGFLEFCTRGSAMSLHVFVPGMLLATAFMVEPYPIRPYMSPLQSIVTCLHAKTC